MNQSLSSNFFLIQTNVLQLLFCISYSTYCLHTDYLSSLGIPTLQLLIVQSSSCQEYQELLQRVHKKKKEFKSVTMLTLIL